MKIIVINLAAEATRWLAVRAQFRDAGLHPLRHEAVCGAALPAERASRLYSEAQNRRQYHRPLRPGEIACYASHIAVWERLLAGEDAHVAIFEDDIEVAPQLPQVLDAIARSPVEWDLVKLIGRSDEKVAARAPLLSDHALIDYRRVPSLTGGYVLNRRGAEKLLARRRQFGRPVDVDLRYWWECGLRVCGVQPYPVRPAATSATSCIDGRHLARGLGGRLRKLGHQANYTWLNGRAVRARDRGVADLAPPLRPGAAGREAA